MKNQPVSLLELSRRFVSLIVALVMIFNLTGEAAAQAVSASKHKLNISSEELEKIIKEKTTAARDNTFVYSSAHLEAAIQRFNQERIQKDPVLKQLESIKNFFFPLFSFSTQSKEPAFDAFVKQDKAAIEKEAAATRDYITSQYDKTLAQFNEKIAALKAQRIQESTPQEPEPAAKKQERLQKIEKEIQDISSKYTKKLITWKRESLAQLAAEERSALMGAKDRFASFQKNLDEQNEQAILAKKQELLSLYNKHPQKALSYVITIAPRLLSYRTLKGESFFTQDEQDLLTDLFIKDLQANDGCLNPKSAYSCERAFSAMSGLGMVGKGSFDASMAVSEFVERHLNINGVAGPVLLAGASALLSMGEAKAVGGILHSAVQKEHNTVFPLSFSEFHDFAKYELGGNQRYLGEVSKRAQFKGEGNTYSNAWEELALMLAAEGSEDSLQVLQDYGVGRCMVTRRGNEFFINCETILPFLAGALFSGKSGAEKYTPSNIITRAGQYFSNAGAGKGVITVTKEEAQKGASTVAQSRQALAALSQNTGLPPAAIFSRYLFLNTMGDLTADEEMALDNKLSTAFAAAVKGKQVKEGYDIKPYKQGDNIYVLKRSSYDRNKWWGIGAAACDVAMLVWFGADIVRNLPKAARWMKLLGNGALASVGKLAGRTRVLNSFKNLGDAAPLMTELSKIHRPNWTRNLNAKIASRLEGVIRAQAPMFASAEFGSNMFRTRTAVSSALSTARFEAGKIVLDKNLVASSRVAAQAQQRLDVAAANVNEQFMREAFSFKTRLFGKDALYRNLWLKELYAAVPAGGNAFAITPNQRAMFEFAGFIRGNKAFTVPQELSKTVSLMPNGKINTAAVLHNLKTAGVSTGFAKETSQVLDKAVELADQSYMYRNRNLRRFLSFVPFGNDAYHALRGNAVYRQILGKKVGVVLNESTFLNPAEKLKLTETLAWNLRRDFSIKAPKAARSLQSAVTRKPSVEYEARAAFVRLDDGSTQALPLTLRMDPRLNGVSDRFYQHVDFIKEKTGEYTLSMINAADKPFKLENFKIIARPGELPKLANAVTGASDPLMVTMSPYAKQGLLMRGWNNMQNWLEKFSWYPQSWRRGAEEKARALMLKDNRLLASRVMLTGDKEERFSSLLQVYRRLDDGSLQAVPMMVKADKFFNMGGLGVDKLVVGKNSFSFLDKANKTVNIKNPFFFGIPKGEAGNLVNALRTSKVTEPLSLVVDAKKTGLWRMYVATGLSLSSASTGLLASLEEYYPSNKPYGASETDKIWITLGLPFIPSFFAPVFTPFVKRWGALGITKAALAISSAGLAFPLMGGFVWSTPQDKTSNVRPEGLPSYNWLYISAGAIGLSSALLRASLNTLIGKASGSTGLVKSMLAKNIGSAALLIPPLVFGGLYSENGDGFASKPPTFASSFPVLEAGSLAALGIMHFSSINRTIGREKGFKFAKGKVWKTLKDESLNAYKLVGRRAMLPMMAGAFMLTGFESAAYNKATNQMLKPAAQQWASADMFNISAGNLNQSHQKKNLTATFTGGALLVAPFIARWKAGPILNLFGADEKVRYTKMLQYSLLSSAAGGGLLLSADKDQNGNMDAWNWSKLIAGGTLLGLGTANVFQSLQNLATARYMGSDEVVNAVKAAKDLKEQKRIKDVYKATSRTVFSAANIGMAVPPVVVSGAMDIMKSDEHDNGPLILEKQVPAYSLGMSYAFLGAGAAISLGSLGVLKKGHSASWLKGLSWPVGAGVLYNTWNRTQLKPVKLQLPNLGVGVYAKPLPLMPSMPKAVQVPEK